MKQIKLFLTDVDGCLTDGGMYYGASGEEMKRFCVYDGMGMVQLRKSGIFPISLCAGAIHRVTQSLRMYVRHLWMRHYI